MRITEQPLLQTKSKINNFIVWVINFQSILVNMGSQILYLFSSLS